MDELNQLSQIAQLFKIEKILGLIIGIVALSFLVKILNHFSKNIQSQFPTKRLIILQITTVMSFCLYIFGTMVLVYSVLQPPKELLIAIGGSSAVAVGFALKDLVASVVAGLTLLFDRPFQVGDRVSFGDIYGEIVSIGLRAVRLNTLDDNLVTIPNSKFITEAVASGNAGALDMMITIPFHVDLDADLREAKRIIKEVVATSRYTYLRKPISIVMTEKSNNRSFWIEILAKAYVLDVRYEKAFQSDIVLRGTEALRDSQIKRIGFKKALI